MEYEGDFEIIETAGQKVDRTNGREMAGKAHSYTLKKLNHKHRAIMDMLIYSPHLTLTEIAKRIDGTVSWVSLVVNCDLFQEELRRQRGKLDSFQRDRLISRLHDSGHKAIDRLDKVLEDHESSDSVAITAAKNVLSGLGFIGGNGGGGVNVNINNAPTVQTAISELGVTREMIEKAKDRRG